MSNYKRTNTIKQKVKQMQKELDDVQRKIEALRKEAAERRAEAVARMLTLIDCIDKKLTPEQVIAMHKAKPVLEELAAKADKNAKAIEDYQEEKRKQGTWGFVLKLLGKS